MSPFVVKRVEVANVESEGTALVLPKGMTPAQAIVSLQRRQAYEQETTDIIEPINVFPWDGALALQKAINAKFGWSQAEWIPGGMFEPAKAPKLIAVETGVGETTNVPWGRFSLPGVTGWIETGGTMKDGVSIFVLQAHVQRRYEGVIKELVADTRRILETDSIYRGKALKIRFTDDDGDDLEDVMPSFLDVASAVPERLIFSDDLTAIIATNLFTPLTHRARLKKHKVPFKRGILLSGTFGTGKTETAFTAANLATQNGITFLYCEKMSEFKRMIQFAQQYGSNGAVIFMEDIDRISKGERTEALNEVLNTVDGIEAKGTEVLVVLTTNDVDAIHESMLRPSRIDAVIDMEKPDAAAAIRLVRLYAGELLDPDEDLTSIGALLAGQIPAVIGGIVQRSKLAAIRLSDNDDDLRITSAAIAESAKQMTKQIALLNRQPRANPSAAEKAAHVIGNYINSGILAADKYGHGPTITAGMEAAKAMLAEQTTPNGRGE